MKCGIMRLEPLASTSPPQTTDFLTSEAFHHQMNLSWEAFLRGRISIKWQLAYIGDVSYGTSHQSTKWAGQLIGFLLHYSQQIWTFRGGVVHGHTVEESHRLQRVDAIIQVQAAFEEYHHDPFHVPSHWRHLFSRPIQYLISSDKDTLACWLRSYSEAVQQQALSQLQQKQQSKLFFKLITSNTCPSSNHQSDSSVDSSCTLESTWDSASETYSDDDDSLLAYVPFDPGD
jgi:hypothetical protein